MTPNRDHYQDLTLIKLSDYEIGNLAQLLRVTRSDGPFPMDTGDWHGQISMKLAQTEGIDYPPNITDDEMKQRVLLFGLVTEEYSKLRTKLIEIRRIAYDQAEQTVDNETALRLIREICDEG